MMEHETSGASCVCPAVAQRSSGFGCGGWLGRTMGWLTLAALFCIPTAAPANPPMVDEDRLGPASLTTDNIATEAAHLGTRKVAPGDDLPMGSVAVESTVSRDLQVYAVPLTFRPLDEIQVTLTVPWVAVHHEIDLPGDPLQDGDVANTSGLGDPTLSLGYLWTAASHLHAITTAFVKAPIGDPEATDGDAWLPVGTKSWDFALYQTFLHDLTERARLEVTAGYRLNTTGRFDADVDYDGREEDITLTRGDVVNILVGVDDAWGSEQQAVGYLKLDFRYVMEADLKADGESLDGPDSKRLFDVLAGVSYFFDGDDDAEWNDGLALRIGARVPITNREPNDLALDLNVSKAF